jgi:hypothetical protein
MKRVFMLAAFIMGAIFSVNAQKSAPIVDQVIKMSKDIYDLGKVKHNEKTTFYIEFTNITKKPVVVENVTVSCGCTLAEKPTEPILPGKTGKVKVGYNGSAAPGSKFSKLVFIKIAGVNEGKTIIFTGETFD